MDAKELQDLAERCRRLAKSETNLDFARKLRELANDYERRACQPGTSATKGSNDPPDDP
jgi:hypothetical protein